MTRQSLDAFRRTVTVNWPKASEQQQQEFLYRTATEGNRKILAEQTSRAGVRPSVTYFANRPGNTDLARVKLPGPIAFFYDYRAEIAKVGLELLRSASPVKSGKYRNSHVILLNGTQVDTLPATLSASDVVTLTNPVPYARRIEIGKTKAGRDFVIQVPNRIYERVAKQKLIPRYRGVANIQFGYIDLKGAHTIKGGLAPSYLIDAVRRRRSKLGEVGTKKRRLRRQKVGDQVKAPAIIIRPFVEKPI